MYNFLLLSCTEYIAPKEEDAFNAETGLGLLILKGNKEVDLINRLRTRSARTVTADFSGAIALDWEQTAYLHLLSTEPAFLEAQYLGYLRELNMCSDLRSWSWQLNISPSSEEGFFFFFVDVLFSTNWSDQEGVTKAKG